MKALSVHQPFASLIASGSKTMEIRTWRTSYRGPLLICSTKRPALSGYPLGVTLCVVDLIDVITFQKKHVGHAHTDWKEGRFAWVLRNVRPVKQLPIKGQQGLFNIDLPIDYL